MATAQGIAPALAAEIMTAPFERSGFGTRPPPSDTFADCGFAESLRASSASFNSCLRTDWVSEASRDRRWATVRLIIKTF